MSPFQRNPVDSFEKFSKRPTGKLPEPDKNHIFCAGTEWISGRSGETQTNPRVLNNPTKSRGRQQHRKPLLFPAKGVGERNAKIYLGGTSTDFGSLGRSLLQPPVCFPFSLVVNCHFYCASVRPTAHHVFDPHQTKACVACYSSSI